VRRLEKGIMGKRNQEDKKIENLFPF